MAALPAFVLAARRETPLVLRPPCLALTGMLLALGVLSESRGWLLTLPVALVVLVVLVPDRVRLALFAVPVAVAGALAFATLLAPYDASGGGAAALDAAVADASRAVLLCALGLLAVGAVLVALDRTWTPSPRTRIAATRGLAALAILAALGGGVAVGVATHGHPIARLDRSWKEFRSGGTLSPGPAGSRFTSLATPRYELWRVAIDTALDHPVLGVGQDNFAQQYLLRRRTAIEEPRWTHSVELRLLAHTGIVGALLFGAWVGLVVLGALRGAREPGRRERRALAGALLAPGVVWLAHGSIEWLWEYPALSGATMLFAGVATRAARRDEPPAAVAASPRGRFAAPWLRPVGLAVAVVGIVLLGTAWIAERDTDHAAADWPADPAAALARLDRARTLAPLDPRPDLVAGLIALRRDRPADAARALGRAAARDPQDWFARFEAGLAESAVGRPVAARAAFRAARARDPREELVADALRRVGTRRPLSEREASGRLKRRVDRRSGRSP